MGSHSQNSWFIQRHRKILRKNDAYVPTVTRKRHVAAECLYRVPECVQIGTNLPDIHHCMLE